MKEPWLAVFLTQLLPGIGHIYAGNKAKGVTILLLYVLLGLMILLGLALFLYGDTGRWTILILAIVVASGLLALSLQLYALFNSHKTARIYNSQHHIDPPQAKKKPWLAVFLTLFLPGLGQFYNKSIVKGIVFLIFIVAVWIAEEVHYLLSFLAFPLYLIAMKDAFETAGRINGFQAKLVGQGGTVAKVFVVVMILIDAIPFAGLIKADYVQAYKLPSGSMIPTLLVGDHILVDKSIAAKDSLVRGDMIVFHYPKDPSRVFIKRVIAVGGDVIEGRNKVVYVNGVLLKENYVQHNDAQNTMETRDNFGPFTVPINSYFVMGDNRDQSLDSRFWGSIPKDYIRGKAFRIYWSWDRENARVRWDRIGMRLQ
jgi:signal peptidase I